MWLLTHKYTILSEMTSSNKNIFKQIYSYPVYPCGITTFLFIKIYWYKIWNRTSGTSDGKWHLWFVGTHKISEVFLCISSFPIGKCF